MRQNAGRMSEILADSAFPIGPPLRSIFGHAIDGEGGGVEVHARVEAAAPVEATLWVGAVEIVQHASDYDALVFVHGMLEEAASDLARVEHQVFADESAGV